jgi:hypothetical protein
VDAIFDTANSQRSNVMFPRDPAYVVPNTFFDLLVNKVTALFCAEDDVVEELGVRVCHILDFVHLPLTRQDQFDDLDRGLEGHG